MWEVYRGMPDGRGDGHIAHPPHSPAATRPGREGAASEAIWQCVSCQTCATRCPKSVDCAGVMDALRQLSAERGVATPEQQHTVLFQKAFLRNIRRNGRLNELELIGDFKLSTFVHGRSLSFLFKDSTLAPELMKRKKFHLVGEKAHDRAVVARIFARCMDDSIL